MKYYHYSKEEKTHYKYGILTTSLKLDSINNNYLLPSGLNKEDVVLIQLETSGKKTPVKLQKMFIEEELLPYLKYTQIDYLLIAHADYYKTMSKSAKADTKLGYVDYSEQFNAHLVYLPSHESVFYDPNKITPKIVSALEAVKSHSRGSYKPPGDSINTQNQILYSVSDIQNALQEIFLKPEIACDIEGFSLHHYDAGIGTIAFAWDEKNGYAFPVDLLENPKDRIFVRYLLKDFFINYKGKVLYHNIGYDGTVLIYQLFMKDILDNENLLKGISYIMRDWEDTFLITYLATNSCSGNKLSLKEQAHEFAGNYAVEEITNIRAIPLKDLLSYNLTDVFSTWYVYHKNYPKMVADDQLEIYTTLFKPSMVDIVQMQLTGMPINMATVKKAKTELTAIYNRFINNILTHPVVIYFTDILKQKWVDDKNKTIKRDKNKKTINDAHHISFNPNSPDQLSELLFEVLELPILQRTKTKKPSTGGDVLLDLAKSTNNSEIASLLFNLADYKAIDKILSSFIPALEKAYKGPDNWHYLFGSFRLGGTVSGRLSSSKPNLQQTPSSGTVYAKTIKQCFEAPPQRFIVNKTKLDNFISTLKSSRRRTNGP